MRYWIYKDSRILGPLAKEDCVLAGGLNPESLVAEENAGVREEDWRCASDIPDFSDLLEGQVEGAYRPGLGPAEGLSFPTPGEDWLAEVFYQESPIIKIDLGRPGESGRPAAVPKENEKQAPLLREAAAVALPTYVEIAPEPSPSAAPPAAEEAPPQPEGAPPAQPPARGRRRVVQLSPAKSFERVMAPPPQEPASASGEELSAPQQAPAQEVSQLAPPVQPPAQSNIPAFLPPESVSLTAMTSPFKAGAVPETFLNLMGAAALESPTSMFSAVPKTAVPGGGILPEASPGKELEPPLQVEPSGRETQEVLAKLAKPEPPKTAATKKPRARRQRSFLVISGLLAATLAAAGWFFFMRNSKDISTAVNMESGRPPVGGEIHEEPGPAPKSPSPEVREPQVPPQTAAPKPAPAPVAQVAAVRDERSAAIELVKNSPLEGERGSVEAWLQYSFASSPGKANTEKWDAGAVEESTYLVQYTVVPSAAKTQGTITYLFEADLARQTVRGRNPAARQMMSGGGVLPQAKRPRVKIRKKSARRPVAPTRPRQTPQLALPSDSELQAPAQPAQEESAFHSDSVQPNP